jgi:curved DNA-binding protein CbpA
LILEEQEARDIAYRLAAKRLHPDAGGSTEDFQKLQEAKRILDEAVA